MNLVAYKVMLHFDLKLTQIINYRLPVHKNTTTLQSILNWKIKFYSIFEKWLDKLYLVSIHVPVNHSQVVRWLRHEHECHQEHHRDWERGVGQLLIRDVRTQDVLHEDSQAPHAFKEHTDSSPDPGFGYLCQVHWQDSVRDTHSEPLQYPDNKKSRVDRSEALNSEER